MSLSTIKSDFKSIHTNIKDINNLIAKLLNKYDQSLETKKEALIKFREKHVDEPRKFSSGPIKNEVLTMTSENPSSGDHFERKFQENISPYDQSIEIQE